MEIFLKTVACALVILLLCLVLGKGSKDFYMILTTIGCCMIGIVAISYIQPVVTFIKELQLRANINTELFSTVLKSVGIALLCEICNLVCADCGNASVGRMIHLLGSGVILWLSIPLYNSLFTLIDKILVTV